MNHLDTYGGRFPSSLPGYPQFTIQRAQGLGEEGWEGWSNNNLLNFWLDCGHSNRSAVPVNCCSSVNIYTTIYIYIHTYIHYLYLNSEWDRLWYWPHMEVSWVIGLPLVIIHLRLGFSLISHPASLGYPHDELETLIITKHINHYQPSKSTIISYIN